MYYATAAVVVAGGAVGAVGATAAAAVAVGGAGGGGADCVGAPVNAAGDCTLVRLSVPLPLLLLVLVCGAALIVGIVALMTFLPLPLLFNRFGCK